MTNYYYLAIVLPELALGEKPDLSFHEFMLLLQENLTPVDYNKTRRLRWFFDLLNVRAYWRGDPLDDWGNLDPVQLEDALLVREGKDLPSYFYHYLDEYENKEERQKNFQKVITEYFKSEAQENTGFLKKLRCFERDIRLVITAFRARQLGRDLNLEFQYEDPEEEIVSQLLAQVDSKEFEPPLEFQGLKDILVQYYEHPLELQKAIVEYAFNWIEDELQFNYFSIDRVLGYMAQFILVERLMRLDKERGVKVLEGISTYKS